MASETPFPELMAKLRGGDEEAAREFLKRYEPYVRRFARQKLTNLDLRREFDSIDICQSVLGAFFVRASLGQFELDTPQDLLRLLAVMARNKVREKARRKQTQGRDGRREERVPIEDLPLAGRDGAPSEIVSGRDLVQTCRNRLSDEERYLVDQRTQGLSWKAIAQNIGGQPDALRMKFKRALDRVAHEMGLEGGGDGRS
jgi:RNA polymerase sigma-70 factor (ECF subfamily)